MKRKSPLQLLVGITAVTLALSVAPLSAQNDNPTGKAGQFNGNSATAGSFDPYTANATRTIVDIAVPGAVGAYPLQFSRTMNSRHTMGPSYGFADAGSWQYSYNWSVYAPDVGQQKPPYTQIDNTPLARPLSYTVHYPDGRMVDFEPRASTPADSAYRGPAGVTDRFESSIGNGFCYLVMSDGGKIKFQQFATYEPELLFWEFTITPVSMIDPYGQETTFQRSSSTFKITEPAGRWLRINYGSAFGRSVIASVEGGNGLNTVTQSVSYTYQQFNVTHPQNGYVYTYVTLTGAAYSDGTTASYTYQRSNTYPNTGPPLIATCDDVRYPGPMKQIAYEFLARPAESDGGIYGEFAIARKWLYPAQQVVSYLLSNHIETRGDGAQRSFSYGSPISTGGVPSNPPALRPGQHVPQPYLLASYTDFSARRTYLGYDVNTFLNFVEDPNENVTTFVRTSLTGKITSITHPPDAAGVPGTIQYSYTDPATAFYLQSVTDELQHTTIYERDGKNRVKEIKHPDLSSEGFTYDDDGNGRGQVRSHRMTSGGTEWFTYDLRARKETYHDAEHPLDGVPTARFQYDTLDRISGVTDPRGQYSGDPNFTTNLDYNQRGQLTIITHPIDSVTGASYTVENGYNPDGTLASVKDGCAAHLM